jgi:hypothetical protein
VLYCLGFVLTCHIDKRLPQRITICLRHRLPGGSAMETDPMKLRYLVLDCVGVLALFATLWLALAVLA